MRSLLLAVLLAGACAHSSTGAQVNIPAVRHEIDDTIAADHGDRTIHSMGHVGADSAVVYTTATNGEKSEETWAKVDGHWKLQTKTALK